MSLELIAVIAGPLIGLIVFLLGRKKLRAEQLELEARARKLEEEAALLKVQSAHAFASSVTKFVATQEKLQDENTELYIRVVAMEKALTDADRTRENLAGRLNDRDEQIKTLSNHLRTLQDKSKQADITNSLMAQMEGITQIAQSYQKIIEEREKAYSENFARITGPLKEKE